jgi:hypothetical protein
MMGSVSAGQRPFASSFNSLCRNIGFMSGTTLGALWLGSFIAWFGGAGRLSVHQGLPGAAAPLPVFSHAASAVCWLCALLCACLAVAYGWYPDSATASA